MIHGPYGHTNPSASCMKDEKCSKNFPGSFIQNTETGRDSYPNYRRRSPGDGGKTATKTLKNNKFQIDNRWVVPHNPWLLRQLQCRVNVEISMCFHQKHKMRPEGCSQRCRSSNISITRSCEWGWNFKITSMHVTSAGQKQLGVFLKCHSMNATPPLCNLRCF